MARTIAPPVSAFGMRDAFLFIGRGVCTWLFCVGSVQDKTCFCWTRSNGPQASAGARTRQDATLGRSGGPVPAEERHCLQTPAEAAEAARLSPASCARVLRGK